MGSQGRRVIKLSEAAQPPNYDALERELNGEQPPPTKKVPALNVVGAVKEKGFSADPVPAARISFPRPRLTPFPVARHRSDGPHWAPPSRKGSPPPARQLDGDGDEGGERSAADLAEPLRRKTDGQQRTSQWRSARKSALSVNLAAQNTFDDARLAGDAQETSTGSLGSLDKESPSPKIVRDEGRRIDAKGKPRQKKQSTDGDLQENVRQTEVGLGFQTSEAIGRVDGGEGQVKPSKIFEETSNPEQRRDVSLGRTEVEGRDFKQADQGRMGQEIDAETRKAVFSMSSEEVADAQADLIQRLRPEVLEALRRRGEAKERRRRADMEGVGSVSALSSGDSGASGIPDSKVDVVHSGTYSAGLGKPVTQALSENTVPKVETDFKNVSDHHDQTAVKQREAPRDGSTARSSGVVVQDKVPTSKNANGSVIPPPTTDSWTPRVEAVRSMRFDLEGNVASSEPAFQIEDASSSSSADVGKQTFPLAAERDYLRTEGDPVGNGYSLRDTLALVRSTVPGQRAAALRLIASVLTKAIQSLQVQTCDESSASQVEATGEPIDWQAVWAYSLGPEAELVLSLRLALDDGHSTVVAACARAMQALLSFSANESYFDALEEIWPEDGTTFTAPIFRKKTKQNEGFIGGGRWKYNVKSCEMFPFSGTAAQKSTDDENGEETVSDDSHVSNKDVAAGLIRMGILPRIRYILEVDRLIAAEEALLSVLICLARHSPAAANAVMTCPRLIDAVVERFVGANGHFSDESWSGRSKAIRLIRVLSQAGRSNCIHFEATGTLQTVVGSLKERNISHSARDEQDLDFGDYANTMEAFCFWRVCVDYGMGVSLFSDCYSTLCFWLLPLSEEEIVSGANYRSLSLAAESYRLLEHLARTLPPLHATSEARSDLGQADPGSWSWGIAHAMVDTAMKWVSPQHIRGIRSLLGKCLSLGDRPSQQRVSLDSNTRKVLETMAAILHFLATVCEKIASNERPFYALDDPDNVGVPWLPTFLPNVGLAIARSGLLNCSRFDVLSKSDNTLLSPSKMSVPMPEAKFTLLECLRLCQRQGDHESAFAAINFLRASVHVSSIVDRLIQSSKPKVVETVADQTAEQHLLHRGLLTSAEMEMRRMSLLCEDALCARRHLLRMSNRGGPAPGVGIGWGAFCGGAWSKEALIAHSSVRLAHNLSSILSSKLFARNPQNLTDSAMQVEQPSEAIPSSIAKRMNFGLMVSAISTVLDRELLSKVFSDTLFLPSTLAIIIEKVKDAITRWRARRDQMPGFQGISRPAVRLNIDPENISKVLMRHFEEFWLAVKARPTKEDGQEGLAKNRRLGPKLATVYEGSESLVAHPESLMGEWVRQRLPLPSYWFLSPMVTEFLGPSTESWKSRVDHNSSTRENPEEIINAGLSFFLGFELLTAEASIGNLFRVDIPLVRKVHSLSTIFLLGGDTFLNPHTQDLIGALQDHLGDQLGNLPSDLVQPRERENIRDGHPGPLAEQVNHAGSAQQNNGMLWTSCVPKLDFEGGIDASYVSYVEALAEKFVASSFGEPTFGRQVALHLSPRVPDMIRLATWRVLKDGSVLDLLPPLSQCCGPREMYLQPIEASQEILDAFVAAWVSGALNKAARKNSFSFTLALHHLSGYLFGTFCTEEALSFKRKTIRLLVRSSAGNAEREEIIARLICYDPIGEDLIATEAPEESKADVESRFVQFSDVCQGDNHLTLGVRRLQARVTGMA